MYKTQNFSLTINMVFDPIIQQNMLQLIDMIITKMDQFEIPIHI